MEPAVVYFAPGLDGFKRLKLSSGDSLLFEKEVIYVGDFLKKDAASEIRFSVTPSTLQHWKQTWDRMLSNGVEIPWPVEHTNDPEKRRANLVGSSVKKDSKNRLGLFAKLKFVNEKAARLAHTTDASIYVVPEFTDGKGNSYFKPIRHVAFTDYPVIPGLDKFQAIAASFDSGETSMASTLLPLAQKLGVPEPESLSDMQLEEAIVQVFEKLQMELEAARAGGQQEEGLPPDGGQSQLGGDATPPVAGGTKTTITTQQLPPAVAASFKTMMKERRQMKLDQLLQLGHITRAARDKLASQHCREEVLALSLSDPSSDASFDQLIEALKENKAWDPSERTGSQNGVALSNPALDSKSNPLIADAEGRHKQTA